MQATIFVDQQCANAETSLRIELLLWAKRCSNAFEALHKSLVAMPQILKIPSQINQPLRRGSAAQPGIKYHDLGLRSRRPLQFQEACISLGVRKDSSGQFAKSPPHEFLAQRFSFPCTHRREDNQGPTAGPGALWRAVDARRRLGKALPSASR